MYFRSLLVYRLTQALPFDADALEAALKTKPARDPASQELSTYGFIAPLGKGDDAPLLYQAENASLLMVSTRKVERILPGSVVSDEVKARVEVIEAEQIRKVYKKERDAIKDDVIQAFLPRAFLRSSQTHAAIDVVNGLVYVNSSSPARAEDLLSVLREVIGSLPVRPLAVKVSPVTTMTQWLKTEQSTPDFHVLDTCELSDTNEDGGTVRCKRQDLTSDEIQTHLNAGKLVTSLSLAYQDKLSFTLTHKLGINGLRWESLLTDKANEDGGDDAAGQFAASFMLMMLTLRAFTAELIEALGGEEIPQGI